MEARTHKDWLEFLRKAADLPIGYSVDDLLYFQRVAERQYPALAPLVAACVHLAQASDLAIAFEGPEPAKTVTVGSPARVHANGYHQREVSPLLRDEKLFPKNTDLIKLANRLLPDMHQYRFDKMSRSSIIGKIIDHMDTLATKKRTKIENALRQAAEATRNEPSVAGSSFFTRWEEIIKNLEL